MRSLLSLPLAAVLGAFLYECWELQPQLDDSFISYRYAVNLVEGNGLVFNLGERVEGYSNLLWTLLVSLGLMLGIDAEISGHVLGVLSSGMALVASYVLACTKHSGSPHRPIAAFAPLVLLACPALPYLATSGMETPLFLATTTGALAAAARERTWTATGLVVAATLTRPDGVLVAAIVFGLPILAAPRSLKNWIPGLIFTAFVLGHTLVRVAYYGAPLPNTFYAKVGGIPISEGFHAVAYYLGAGMGPLLLPAAYAARHLPAMRGGAAFVGIVFAYVVWIGGGGLLYSRFLIPALGACAALAARGSMHALDEHSRFAPIAVACLLSSALWYLFSPAWGVGALLAGVAVASVAPSALRDRPARALALAAATVAVTVTVALALGAPTGFGDWRNPLSTASRGVGIASKRQLDRNLLLKHKQNVRQILAKPSIRLVAAAGIGALGYYSRLPIVDYLGLVDPVVARSDEVVEGAGRAGMGHQRSAASYVLGREPDLIKIARKDTHPKDQMLPAVVAIWQHPDLEHHYVWHPALGGYLRRDLRRRSSN